MKTELFGNVTLGADPELFLINLETGQPFGARDCSTGTKEEPEPLIKLLDGCFLQVDGLALEFNIPPCDTLDSFNSSLKGMLDVCEGRANEQGLTITDASYLEFEDYIKNCKPTEEELEFGCAPDINAYTGLENEMPDSNDEGITYRTTGGHVHIGFSEWSDGWFEKELTAYSIVKLLDASLGLWSVINDTGHERKKLYGNAGAMRHKDYGLEYRTLSNFWIFNKEYRQYVFTTVTDIVKSSGEKLRQLLEFAQDNEAAIVSSINDNKPNQALLDKFMEILYA